MTDIPIDLTNAKLLIVDDVPTNLDVIYQSLQDEGYEVFVATDGETALEVVAREHPDLVLLDVMMPGIDGFEVCRRLKANAQVGQIPVIFLTARHETDGVVQGFQAGGVDYVTKPFQKEEVLVRIRTHLEYAFLARALVQKNRDLEAEIARRTVLDNRLSMMSEAEKARWDIDGFVGQSRMMQDILKKIRLLQNADAVSVLITGESGTGKELVARAIHTHSLRAKAPFVVVNCATIPKELAESMLFGHLKGSFTGADRDQLGYFELANEGTLFLDEIGTMPVELQPKLLRVLEDGVIRPLGASEDKQVDVRILAATNAPEAFRDDLYYRLARFTVELPPLRARKEDIPLLSRHFLRMFAAEMQLPVPDLSAQALVLLDDYDFPGNIRELKNMIEHALIMSEGATIEPHHLQTGSTGGALGVSDRTHATLDMDMLPWNFEEAEMVLIRRAMEHTQGNISDAAQLMGIHRSKIYRKLAQFKEK